MPKFQTYYTEDLITVESSKQAIAIIGFSISKLVNKSSKHLSGIIVNYLDSFGYSYVLQISRAYARFFILVSGKNAGEVINKVSILLDKMDRRNSIDSHLVLSPLQHGNIAKNMKMLEGAQIKGTSNPKIIQIDDRFWVFSSILLSENNIRYFTRYVRNLLSSKSSILNMSTRILKKSNDSKKYMKTIMFANNYPSFAECEEFLKHLERISLQYKQKLTFSLHFHSYKEIRRKWFLFYFGLSNKNQTLDLWNDVIRIDKFIPYLEIYDDVSTQQVDTEEKQEVITANQKDVKATQTIQLEQSKNENGPVFPYGIVVSEDEIDKLIKNIPSTNT
ncbi:MAG: hypothetical protein KAS63_01285 [Candidatus Heimdallarchaeota archaeon]|nr:hypothetical protein [Candidatus Heimdallarchaeota archaeon]MCK4953976.1 hypothetical protein [Candidatus Heimdallarchaeota archaeon]